MSELSAVGGSSRPTSVRVIDDDSKSCPDTAPSTSATATTAATTAAATSPVREGMSICSYKINNINIHLLMLSNCCLIADSNVTDTEITASVSDIDGEDEFESTTFNTDVSLNFFKQNAKIMVFLVFFSCVVLNNVSKNPGNKKCKYYDEKIISQLICLCLSVSVCLCLCLSLCVSLYLSASVSLEHINNRS
jgi:hypothetical protein